MRKAILESNFDKNGWFDLGKPIFVMWCLAHVLDNSCKEGLIYVQSGYYRVDTEVIRRNVQRCVEKSQKRAKALETVQKDVGLPCKIIITPITIIFAYIIHSFRSILKKRDPSNTSMDQWTIFLKNT